MNRALLAEAAADLAGFLRFQKALGSPGLILSAQARAALDQLDQPGQLDRLDQLDQPGQPDRPDQVDRIDQQVRPGPPPTQPSGPDPAAADRAEAELARLAQEAAGCARCNLARGRTKLVFGEGPAGAAVMFIGEGPGHDEDLSGRPFVGKAGQLLTKIIQAMGFDRSEVYIANVVKCRPPNNRAPKPEEAAACAAWLDQQIDLVEPQVIVSLGKPAAQRLLNTTEPISRLRGRLTEYKGRPLMPTFHPSYLLRQVDREAHRLVWEDMKQVLARLGRKPPPRG